jgi:hypothetical protein
MKDFSTIESTVISLLSTGSEILDSNVFPSEIAFTLCGIANQDLALAFMKGDDSATRAFLDNVYFNGDKSDKYILRAIQLHLSSKQI